MIWVFDPLVFSVCAPLLPDRCSATAFHYAGVHRWYLLAMLWIKLALMAMRVARLPPLLQCVLVSALAFLVPPEVGCLTSARCESSSADDPAFWRGSLACDPISPLACTRREDGLRTTLAPLWRILFQGPYADSWSMFSSAFMRYYVLFASIYFWTFHYGRPAARAVAASMRRPQRRGQHTAAGGVGASDPSSSPGTATRLAAVVGLVAVELTQSAVCFPPDRTRCLAYGASTTPLLKLTSRRRGSPPVHPPPPL